MTTPNALEQETRPSEITRAPLAVVVAWVSVFVFGAAFWAVVFHVAPVVVRHVYRSVRAEQLKADIHPSRLVVRAAAPSLSGDRSFQATPSNS
jgi:hypothetical protein